MNPETLYRFRKKLKNTIWNSPFLFQLHLHYRQGKRIFQHRFFKNPPLRTLMVEVTNHCNLSCIICGNSLIRRKKGFMDGKTVDAIRQGLPSAGLNYIAMHAQGEPLLHPNLAEFIQKMRPHAKERMVSTNALLALQNPDLPQRLIDAGMNHLHCSGDGYDADTYERVRVNGRFEDFMESLALFKKARDRLNPDMVLELFYCVVHSHTPKQFHRVFQVYEKMVDEIVFKPMNNQANIRIPADLDQNILGFHFYLTGKRRPCRWLWWAPTVLWDGRVSACCRNYDGNFIMGNVHEAPLKKIWHDRSYRTLRKDHALGHFPEACKDCTDLYEDEMRILLMNRWIRKRLGKPDFKFP